MLEESMSAPPSFWASVISWFTPTVLFVFLNLTIGTIFFTSTLNKPSHHQDDTDTKHLPRSPPMLHRLQSINLHAYRSQEPEKSPDSDTHFAGNPQIPGSPSVLHRLRSINLQSYFSQEPTSPTVESEPEPVPDKSPETEEEQEAVEEQPLEEIYSQVNGAQVSRTKSDTAPASGEKPEKLPRKMRKSASAKSEFAHFEEEDMVEIRRPATMREGKVKDPDQVDEEVDAKADDFINRFKQQLKLQRID